jgi:hypothetical protein
MKSIRLISIFLCVLFTMGCENELDNYDAPNGGITGTIIDSETGEAIPLPVQGSNGVIINMFEQGTNATKSIDFYAKMDGTYENSKMFNCDYKIVVNGPFVVKCEDNVKVNGYTRHDIKATPYSRISVNASVSGTVVTVNYEVKPSDPNFKVSEVNGYWNFAPGVDNSNSNFAEKSSSSTNVSSGSFTFDLSASKVYSANSYKISANGNRIYVRVSAKTQGVYNYSKIIEVIIK